MICTVGLQHDVFVVFIINVDSEREGWVVKQLLCKLFNLKLSEYIHTGAPERTI